MTLGMKKVMVEVPDRISDEYAQDELNRAFSPDWISLHWHISDVQECVGDDYAKMSDEDARDILEEIEHRHDASNGVNWDTINCYVDMWQEHQLEEV